MCRTVDALIFSSPRRIDQFAPAGSYKYWVREATRQLRWFNFGTWYDDPPGPGSAPNLLTGFFDSNYWQIEIDYNGARVLGVNPGREPSQAIDAIFDRSRLSKWKIDCDHTVQIANLYALRMVVGADTFNVQAMGKDEYGKQRQPRLRPRDSDGLKTDSTFAADGTETIMHWARDLPTDPWREVIFYDQKRIKPAAPELQPKDKNGNPIDVVQATGPFIFGGLLYPRKKGDETKPESPEELRKQTTELVGSLPAGSRVRWTNLEAPLDHPFRHENCVKLEYDLYAARGVDPPQDEFTQATLEHLMANKDNTTKVFIDEVEVFKQH